MATLTINAKMLSANAMARKLKDAVLVMTGTQLPVKIVYAINRDTKLVSFYSETVEEANRFATLPLANDAVSEELERQEGEQYELFLTGLHGRIFSLKMKYEVRIPAMESQKEEVDDSFYREKVEAERARIIREGIAEESYLDFILDELRTEHRIPEKKIWLLLATRWKTRRGNRVEPKTWYKNRQKGVSMIERGLDSALNGYHLILVGEKSVGKDCYAETLMSFLNLEFYHQGGSEDSDADSFIGTMVTNTDAANALNVEGAYYHMLVESGKAGALNTDQLMKAATFAVNAARASSVSIERKIGPFVHALQDGAGFILDEANMIPANLKQLFLHPIADGSRSLYIQDYGIVPVHPDFFLILTQNPDSYAGAMEQNVATLSRFDILQFPYPDSILDILYASGQKELDKRFPDMGFAMPERETMLKVDSFYKEVRKQFEKGLVSDTAVNVRGYARAIVKHVTVDAPLAEAIETSVLNAIAVPEERDCLLTILKDKTGIKKI